MERLFQAADDDMDEQTEQEIASAVIINPHEQTPRKLGGAMINDQIDEKPSPINLEFPDTTEEIQPKVDNVMKKIARKLSLS